MLLEVKLTQLICCAVSMQLCNCCYIFSSGQTETFKLLRVFFFLFFFLFLKAWHTILISKSVQCKILGIKMHSCPCLSSHALCNNYFHVLSQYVSGRALSQGSSYHTSYAPVVWVSHWSVWHLRTCCLNLVINSFSKLMLCHWRLAFFPPSLPRKSKTAAQERDGKEKEGGDLICLAHQLPQLQNIPFLLPAPYTPPEGSWGWN